jgi:hypothetical protein
MPLLPPKGRVGDIPVSTLNPTNGPPSFGTLLAAPILNVNGVIAIEPALTGAAQSITRFRVCLHSVVCLHSKQGPTISFIGALFTSILKPETCNKFLSIICRDVKP